MGAAFGKHSLGAVRTRRLARGKYCAAGTVDIVDVVNGHDVTWESSQPGGELSDALNRNMARVVGVLMRRVDDLYDDGIIEDDERERRLALLGRIDDIDAVYVHTGPGLMGDDYRLHLCAKLRK